jgi:hypothetical protein
MDGAEHSAIILRVIAAGSRADPARISGRDGCQNLVRMWTLDAAKIIAKISRSSPSRRAARDRSA